MVDIICHKFSFPHLGAKGLGTAVEKASEKVVKLASLAKIVPGLSVIAGAFGLVESLTKPTTQDIINKVNEGFQKFVGEVNTKLDQTRDYVDANIVQTLKEVSRNELLRMEGMWMDCFDETSNEGLKRCQRDKVR